MKMLPLLISLMGLVEFAGTARAETLETIPEAGSLPTYRVLGYHQIHRRVIDSIAIDHARHRIATSAYDRYLKMTDVSDPTAPRLIWEWEKPIQGSSGRIPVVFSADGRLLAFGDHRGNGYIFDATTGAILFQAFLGEAEDPEYHGLRAVVFNEGVDRVFFARNHKVYEFDIGTQALLNIYEAPLRNYDFSSLHIASGKLLASGHGRSHFWDLGRRDAVEILDHDVGDSYAGRRSGDLLMDRYIPVFASFNVYYFDWETGARVQSLLGATADYYGSTLARGGRLFIGCTVFGVVHFFETRTGRNLQEYQLIDQDGSFDSCQGIVSAPDASKLYIASGIGTLVVMMSE